jgi:hypothetical protein
LRHAQARFMRSRFEGVIGSEFNVAQAEAKLSQH